MPDTVQILTADKAFVSLAYLNIIRMPLAFLPIIIVYLVQSKVSLEREAKCSVLQELKNCITK